MEDFNVNEVVKNEFSPVKEVQFDIYKKYPQEDKQSSPKLIIPGAGTNNLMGGTGMQELKQKPSFSREVPVTEAYDLVGDEWMAKFPTYKQGSDNKEYAAQTQSGWEQTVNGLSKAGLNVGSVVAENTVGFVYGLTDWAKTGNFSSVYDNSFSKSLDDWNTKLGYQLPNYYTKDQQDAGFFGSLGSANFLANDVANGVSFTLGTIVSEAIWAYATGGASIPARMGQWGAKIGQGARFLSTGVRVGEEVASASRFGKALLGSEKVAEGLANYKGFVYEALDNAVTTGKLSKTTANVLAKTGEVINTTRFIGTSSGNEAGIEAFHFKKEATENFYRDFEKLNGRKPTAEESAEMLDKIDGAANNVFASNMAILGVSNLAMLGGMFNLKSPISRLQKSVNQKLFGIGTKEISVGEDLVFKGLERKGWQKAAGYLYKGTAPVVREGMFEEGLQGATTKTANHWIERQYDPKYLNKVMSLSDDAWKAMGEQYGTKAGWKEIGIGGIVGILGGSVTGEFSQFNRMAEEQEKVVSKGLNAANVTMKTFVSDINAGRMMTTAKIMESEDRAERAMTKKDVVSAKLAHNDSMIALAEMYDNPLYGTGGLSQMEKHGFNMIDTTEVSEEEKNELKQGFKSFISDYKSASTFANSIVGSQGKVYGTNFQANDVKKALTYTILQGESSKKMMDESLNSMQSFMNVELIDAVKRNDDLQALGKDKKRVVTNLSQQYRNWEKKSEAVQKQVQVLQAAPNEVEGDKKSRLIQMQQKLIEIEENKANIRAELEGISKEIAQNKKMQQSFGQDVTNIPMIEDFIAVDDLINLETKLDELEKSHGILREVNPISAQAIEEHMANYKKAQQALLDHNTAIKLIASGTFKPKLTGLNPFSGLYDKFSKGEVKEDDHTSQFLTRLNKIRNSYIKDVFSEGQEKSIEGYQKSIDEIKAKETLTEEDTAKIAELETKIQALQKPIEEVKDDTPSKGAKTAQKVTELSKKLTNLEEKLKKATKVFRTEGTGLGKLGISYRGTGVYYALDKPFTNNNENEVVSELFVEMPKNILDITTDKGQKVYAEILEKTTADFNKSDKSKPFYDLISEEAVKRGYEGIISYIETEDKSQGREFVSFKGNLVDIKKQIENLKKEIRKETPQKELSPVEALKARIEDILKLFKTSFVGTYDVDEAVKNRPDQKDIERYRELLNQEPTQEFEELRAKLSQWRVYDSLAEDEQSVADLLNIVAQLETEVEQQNTISEPNIEDVFTEDKLKATETIDLYDLSVNTNFPVTVKKDKATGNYNITHMNPSSLLTKLGATEVKIGKKPMTYQEIDEFKKTGVVVTFMSGGISRKFTIAERGRLNIAAEDFNAIPNVKTIDSLTSWTYPNLYERDFEGNWRAISSDFSDPNITGDSNNLKDNDAIELFVDVNNEYNQKLLKQKLTSEELANQVVIYIKKGGEIYGMIKGIPNRENVIKASEHQIITLRDLAGEMLTNGESGVVATTSVSYVQLGNPILSINGNGAIAQNEITATGVKNVAATGYVLDGEIVLNKEIKDVRRSFIKKITEKNKGKKVPIIVIKRGSQMIAFPIQMVKLNVSKLEDLNLILDNTEMTDAQKVSDINNLLIANGIAPKEFDLITLDENKVNAIADRLDKNEEFKTAEQLADKKYKKENLINDATIALDLENLVVSLPSQKFNIDMEGISYEDLATPKVEKQEVLEKLAEKEIETPQVKSAKKQVNKPKTAIEKEEIEVVESNVENAEEIAKTIVSKIKEIVVKPTEESIIPQVKQPQINLVSFETVDFTGTPTTFYKKGSKWGYLNSNGIFDSLIPNAQMKIESEYQAKKELEKAEKDSKC